MQYIDHICQSCEVNYPKCAILIGDLDFFNSSTHDWHVLEVIWRLSALDLFKLETSVIPRIFGKLAQALQ